MFRAYIIIMLHSIRLDEGRFQQHRFFLRFRKKISVSRASSSRHTSQYKTHPVRKCFSGNIILKRISNLFYLRYHQRSPTVVVFYFVEYRIYILKGVGGPAILQQYVNTVYIYTMYIPSRVIRLLIWRTGIRPSPHRLILGRMNLAWKSAIFCTSKGALDVRRTDNTFIL
jgi:hypothetical protein